MLPPRVTAPPAQPSPRRGTLQGSTPVKTVRPTIGRSVLTGVLPGGVPDEGKRFGSAHGGLGHLVRLVAALICNLIWRRLSGIATDNSNSRSSRTHGHPLSKYSCYEYERKMVALRIEGIGYPNHSHWPPGPHIRLAQPIRNALTQSPLRRAFLCIHEITIRVSTIAKALELEKRRRRRHASEVKKARVSRSPNKSTKKRVSKKARVLYPLRPRCTNRLRLSSELIIRPINRLRIMILREWNTNTFQNNSVAVHLLKSLSTPNG